MRHLLAAIALLFIAPVAADVPLCGSAQAFSCCKVCGKGKACGNTCIAKDKNCHQPPGCACDG